MHELSIALSILDIAAEEAERRGSAIVRTIYVRIGPLAGVVTEALQAAFELARESSPFPAAALVIDEVPLIVYCQSCAAESAASIQAVCCARCNGPAARIVSGGELDVTALEIEEAAVATAEAIP